MASEFWTSLVCFGIQGSEHVYQYGNFAGRQWLWEISSFRCLISSCEAIFDHVNNAQELSWWLLEFCDGKFGWPERAPSGSSEHGPHQPPTTSLAWRSQRRSHALCLHVFMTSLIWSTCSSYRLLDSCSIFRFHHDTAYLRRLHWIWQQAQDAFVIEHAFRSLLDPTYPSWLRFSRIWMLHDPCISEKSSPQGLSKVLTV